MEIQINWKTVWHYSKKGDLAKLLQSPDFPPSIWEAQDSDDWSFIHYAAGFSGNHDALVMLIKAGCNLEKCTSRENTPINLICDLLTLKILCVAGANLRAIGEFGNSFLYSLIFTYPYLRYQELARFVLANGVRLKSLGQK